MTHQHIPPRLEREHAAVRVTVIGAVLDLVLGLAKIAGGLIANSVALVSDGIHSLSDLASDAFVVLMARVSHREADRNHPYGHGRFETIGTVVISVALFLVAGGIAWDSLRRLQEPELLITPGWPAFAIILLSILGKEWIYHYTRRVAEAINSSMLMANAWHSRSDALSSIVVLIGLVAAWLGYLWADLVAALIVAVLIARIAWQLLWNAVSELLDTALPEKELNIYREHLLEHTQIQGVHDLRARRHGAQILIDIHVQVGSRISVSEGHFIAERANRSLKQAFPAVSDVVVHIDPEFDRAGQVVNHESPVRREVEAGLFECWEGLLGREDVERLILHYLAGRIEVEVILESRVKGLDPAELVERCRGLNWLHRVRFFSPPGQS